MDRQIKGSNNRTVFLYDFGFIALLVTTVGSFVRTVQCTHQAELRTKIIFKRGRAKIPGVKFYTAYRQHTNLLLDKEMLSVGNRIIFVAKKRFLIEFQNGKLRPRVERMNSPIIAVNQNAVRCCTTFAHNLFDTIIVRTEHPDASFIKISDLGLLPKGTEMFIHTFGRMFYLTCDMRAYITDQYMHLENGTRFRLCSMDRYVSPEVIVDIPGLPSTVTLEWEYKRSCGNAFYRNGGSSLNCMLTDYPAIYKYNGHVIITCGISADVVFCEPFTDSTPTFINYSLIWPNHSYELLCGQLRAKSTRWVNMYPTLEYFAGYFSNDVYINSRNYCGINFVGDKCIAFDNHCRPTLLRPFVQIPDIWACVNFQFGKIRNLYHLCDGTIVFITSFNSRVYKTEQTFSTVAQLNDYSVKLDGETYYYSREHRLTNHDKFISLEPGMSRSAVSGRIGNGMIVIQFFGNPIVFRNITHGPEENVQYFKIAKISEGRYITSYADTIIEGFTENPTAMRTKPAPRDIEFGE